MISKKIVLKSPPKLVDKPIVCKLVKDFNLTFNILRARVTPREEGELVIELQGLKEKYAEGIKYLKDLGVKIQPLSQDVTRDEERCTHCGQCVSHCPTGALRIGNEATREVVYNEADCIECLACIRVCPFGACTSAF